MARGVNGLVKRARLARCGVGTLRLKANQATTTAVNDVIGNLGSQHDRRALGSMGAARTIFDLCAGL